MRKNTTGQYVAFQAISKTDGSDVITGTPVVYYTIDGGTQAQTTATAVHEGNGQWSVALSQAETNGDHIVFSFVLTGAVTQTVNVYTIDADLTNLDVAVSTRSTVAATDIVSGGAITTSGGAVSNVTLVATTTTNTDMRGTDGANTVAPDNASIAAILVDTGTDIPASIAALNNFDPATDTVANVTTVGTVTNSVTTDAASRTASQADVSGLATAASIAALNDITAASVYSYFVSGTNADALKADVSSLASQSSIDTVDLNVDAIKVKTDQLTFTNPNSVDATATADVDEAAIADAVIAGIGGTDVTISSVIAEDGTTITIVRGDDYSASDSRAITWTGTTDDQWPSLSGATLKFTAKNNMDSLSVTPTVTQPTGTQAFRMELTNTDTEIMSGRYKYDVQATLASGRVITLVVGEMVVKQTYTDRP